MLLFDGKLHAQKLDEQIKKAVEAGCDPEQVLAIIQVGTNASSEKYVELKRRLCEKVGIACSIYKLSENLNDDIIGDTIGKIFDDHNVCGGIIQLPLPRVSLKSVLNLIPIEKDIDLLSSKSTNRFYSGDFAKLPPVIRALKYFLGLHELSIKELRVVVIGDGSLVGKPVAFYLSKLGAKVEVLVDYKTGDNLTCDLLVLSAGVPALVRGEDIAEGASVVDFGSSVIGGKTVGDLDLNTKLDHLKIVSPSPGGMGPLVVRYLIMNFLGL